MEETEYWHDIDLSLKLALIGKTVMVGLYRKDDGEHEGSVTGTLLAVSEGDDRVDFVFTGEATAWYDPRSAKALVSWLANDLKV